MTTETASRHSPWPAYWAVVVSGIFGATGGLFAAGLQTRSVTAAGWRMGMGVLMLALTTLVKREDIVFTRQWARLALPAGLSYATALSCYVAAAQRTSLLTLVLLSATFPLFVSVHARLIGEERLPPAAPAALALAGVGAVLPVVGRSGGDTSVSGVLFLMLSLSASFAYFRITRRAVKTVSPRLHVLGTAMVATVCLSPAVVTAAVPPAADLWRLAGMALLPGTAATWLTAWAQKRTSSSVVGTVSLVSIPAGGVLGWVGLQQHPTPGEMIGAVLVTIGVAVLFHVNSEASRRFSN